MDHGLPSLSSTQTLTVEVGDVNDQVPVFSQTIYNASVAENRDPGEPVFRVSASDNDSGKNLHPDDPYSVRVCSCVLGLENHWLLKAKELLLYRFSFKV